MYPPTSGQIEQSGGWPSSTVGYKHKSWLPRAPLFGPESGLRLIRALAEVNSEHDKLGLGLELTQLSF
jgi:hypothetical protein